jgi:eukaryotic-like serine/threonine-protein kinase
VTPTQETSQPSPADAHARETVRARLFDQPRGEVRVGRFTLLDKAGEGGMGVVFAAYDPELDRRVAIKLLHSEDPDYVQRLLREGKAMARLSHPHVVTIYETGTAGDRVYLAMEFVRGSDLRRWLAEASRSWRDALALLVQAARGLAAAHAAGLVHRDFKPANVLVTDAGIAKVADFGLARPIGDGTHDTLASARTDPGSPTITREGTIVGTPAYLAPEVFEGRPADAKSDQFSFCVTAYEAVYGERPFAGDSLSSLADNAARGQVRAPPQHTRVPARVRRQLVRGLANDPNARHASLAELADRLDALAARRRRVATIAIVGGIAAASFAGAWQLRSVECTGAAEAWASAWSSSSLPELRDSMSASGHPGAIDTADKVAALLDTYGAQWMASHVDACEAHRRGMQSADLLDRRMACLDARNHRVATLVAALEHADATVVEHAIESASGVPDVADCDDVETLARAHPLPDDPAARARILDLEQRYGEAAVLRGLGQAEAAKQAFATVRELADALEYRPIQALVRIQQLDLTNATPALRDRLYDALHLAEAGDDDHAAMSAWAELIRTHGYLGEYDAAVRAARHAEAFVERSGGGARELGLIADRVGVMELERGDRQAALHEATRAVTLLESEDPDAPALVALLGHLGTVYTLLDQNELAAAVYERAYEHAVATFGDTHRDVAGALFNLGRVTARQEQYDASNDYYRRALAIMHALGGDEELTSIFIRNNLGQNYGHQGHYPEAIATVLEAIGGQERRAGPRHRVLVRLRRGLAEIYLDAGELERALAESRLALDISVETFGDDHFESAACRRRVGRVLIALHREAEAVPLLERALKDEVAHDAPVVQQGLSRYWLAVALHGDAATVARARELAEAAIPGLLAGEPRDRRRAEHLRGWLAGERSLEDAV